VEQKTLNGFNMGSARFWKLSPINLGVGLLCFKENPLLQWNCGISDMALE